MKALCNKLNVLGALSRFHKDDDGAETIENICLLAIAAMVLYGIYQLWKSTDLGYGEGGIFGIIVTGLKALVTAVKAAIA